MSREIDVDELLDMIKTGKIDEYLVEINEGEELDYEDDLSSLRWIKNNIHIKPDQKEKMKEAIFNDEYDPVIMSWFEAAMLDKNEIKTLINGKNGLNNEIYTFFIVATGDIEEYLTDDKIEELGLDSYDIKELIEETGNIEKYLTTGNVQKWGLDSPEIKELIEKTGKIEDYLTADKMQEFGLDSYDIKELIEETENIEKYLTTGNVQKWGLDPYQIKPLIEKTGNIEKYLTADKMQEFGFDSYDITELIVKTGKIEDYLTEDKIQEFGLNSKNICRLISRTGNTEKYLTTGNVQKWGLKPYDIKKIIEETENIEKYLTTGNVQKWGLNSYDITELIEKTGKIEDYLTEDKIQEWGLNSPNICRLISITGNIEKYLTTGNVQKWGLNSKEVLNLITNNLNDSNIHLIYDLGFNHTNIESCEILHKNLDYILKKEKQTEKKEIIKKLYEKNNDIVKVKFEILDNKYLQTLGEDKINQISCYPEQVDDILTLNEKELRLLGRCLDLYEGEDWTPLCKRILGNIGTYTKLLETIDNIDEMQSEDIEDLTTVLLHENYLDIECIEDVKNFESIKQKKCIEMFKSGDIDDKINAICISKFGQPKSEIVQFIEKYADGIDYIEDEDLQCYIKSVVEVLSIEDTEILNNIFKNVEPVKNVNSIAMERNLKNEYGKLYNKGLFTIDQAQKCENLGDNIYEVPVDENGNIANFNMIITSIAPFVANSPDNFCKDWNRPALASQHFCANYIRRDMLGRAPMPHLCYGFSDMKEESLTLSGSCDIYSSGAEFVSYARHDERYLPPDQQINETGRYNEMDFRRIQGGEKRQPDYIVVFRKDGEISNMDKAQMASEQFGEATGKKLPIVIIDEDKCLETESRLVGDMIENFNNSPSREKAELICQKIRNNRVRNPSFSSDIDISYIQKYSEKNNNEPTVTINEFEQCFAETKPEEREGMVKKFKSFYKALSKELGKEVARNNEEKSR